MELADIIIKKIEEEDTSKASANILICFSKKITGKALGELTQMMLRFNSGKSSITMLNLINKEQAENIEDKNIYKSELYSDINISGETDKLTVRTFVKESENFAQEIIHTAEEQKANIVLFGIGHNLFSSDLWVKYLKLRSESTVLGEEEYKRELGEKATYTLRNITTILKRQEYTSGILVTNRYRGEFNNIFIPILRENDAYALPFLYQLGKNQNVTITVWDAIGFIESNPKLQKLFNSISRRADGKIGIWRNDRKIEDEFIQQMDLMIIGSEGWSRLIVTPLSWINHLPSVLIINDKID